MANSALAELTAEINGTGIHRTNKFEIEIPLPNGLLATTEGADLLATARVLRLYGESASIPGLATMTHDVRRYGYGPTEKKPVAPVFQDWTVTFRVDANGYIVDFFRQWQRLILGFETTLPDESADWNSRIGTQGYWPNELAYKSDYAVNAKIRTLLETGPTAIEVTLRELYPIVVGDLQQDWSRPNEYAKLAVSFTYFDWFSSKTAALPPATGNATTPSK